MFMRNNRALNGAPQPEEVEDDEAAEQRAQRVLSTSPTDIPAPQKRTFEPELGDLAAIAHRHMMGGLEDGGRGDGWEDYSDMIPCGPVMH